MDHEYGIVGELVFPHNLFVLLAGLEGSSWVWIGKGFGLWAEYMC